MEEDIPLISKYFPINNFRSCDYSIGGIFMWRDYFKTSFCIENDCLFFKVKYINGQTCFTFPQGNISDTESLALIEDYAKKHNLNLCFCTVVDKALTRLQARYQDRVLAHPMRDWFDYLHEIDNLIELKGKKYSTQRNHINNFLRHYPDFQYYSIDQENIHRVKTFIDENAPSLEKSNPLAQEELFRTKELLDCFFYFNLIGGFIEIEGKVAAISVGEIVGDTLLVHIEKALIQYPGIYQKMMNEFAKNAKTEEIRYLNREEDVGDPGLRKSKLSYHPDILLAKYLVEIR